MDRWSCNLISSIGFLSNTKIVENNDFGLITYFLLRSNRKMLEQISLKVMKIFAQECSIVVGLTMTYIYMARSNLLSGLSYRKSSLNLKEIFVHKLMNTVKLMRT